jgi:hypothetical protein
MAEQLTMKTSELIEALAADRSPQRINLGARFCLALGVGALVSACLFMMMLGPRSNFVVSLQSMRFDLKFIDTLAFALPAAVLGLRVLRPDARVGVLGVAFLAPFVLLGAGVIGELLLVPADLWGTRMIGSNSMHCLTMVPLLSLAPLAALVFAMRAGAPQNPAIAGALAGAAAAGIAATLYAANCPDDSPLFVASWYPLATIIVAAIGAAAGARLLRW